MRQEPAEVLCSGSITSTQAKIAPPLLSVAVATCKMCNANSPRECYVYVKCRSHNASPTPWSFWRSHRQTDRKTGGQATETLFLEFLATNAECLHTKECETALYCHGNISIPPLMSFNLGFKGRTRSHSEPGNKTNQI